MALIALCAPIALAQQSPRPVPKQEQAQPPKSEQPPAGQQQAAPQPPIVVNVLPSPKTQKELEEERHEREEKAKLDARLVDLTAELSDYTGGLYRATLALAIATGLLVLATAGLVAFAYKQSRDMKASVEVARTAASAAQSSAETADTALRTTQRAYIGIEPDGIRPYRRRREGEPLDAAVDVTGHFIFRNVGHLSAQEVTWFSDITCSKDRKWKPPLVEDDALEGDMVITPGTRVRRATTRISSADLRKGGWCYVWGRVRYRDGFGNIQNANFCHRHNCVALREDNTIPEEHARYHEFGNEGT
jgi:hypothetical protein